MESPPNYKLPPPEICALCRQIVLEVATTLEVHPGHITSHIRTKEVVKARKLAMRLMLAIGLRRVDLAVAFNRDLRRVRGSVVSPTVLPAVIAQMQRTRRAKK
jgi:hypothetical protein